ncbi:MAG: tol-pal system-associated acyl-CoA thioesterase [Pseudomonadota bacterium]
MQTEEALSDKNSFIWPIRVYYEDTDCGGVVYHSNYLKFMEQARTEWLRHLGLEQDVLINDYGIIFAVRSLSIDYLKPALFNQLLKVETIIEKMGKISLFFKQLIYCEQHPQNKQLLSSANVKIVCLAYDQQLKKILGPKKLPEDIYQRLQIADRNKNNHA